MTSPRLLNQEDYVRRSQQQHGANPLYETSAPSPYTPHSASSVVALHQEHLAGLYSYPLQQPYFNPHSLATAQQFQPQNSTDLTALLNQSSAILDRLENWEKVVQHRTSRKTPSTSADELSQQGLPQQNDDASPTSGAASPTSPRQTNTAGADSGLSNPSGTTGDEEETAFLETQDAIANIPHGIRRKVENYVRQLEDQLRALRKEDKESSDDLYTEEDLLLTAKFYQFRETDLAGIASRSRQSVRRWNPWNAYYKKHYPTTSIAHIPEDELKAIQPANPTPQWFELTAAKRMQMQIMMAKNSILSAKFADLQKNQNTDEWKQLVAEAEEYNAKAARKWQQTNGTRLHDRDRNVLNPVREEGVRESIRKDFITYMLGWVCSLPSCHGLSLLNDH